MDDELMKQMRDSAEKLRKQLSEEMVNAAKDMDDYTFIGLL